MNRRSARLGIAVLALAVPALADFDPPRWQRRRPIQANAPGLAVARLDREVLAAAQPDLADLRVVAAGQEIAYVVRRGPTRLTADLQPQRSEDRTRQATLLTGEAPFPYDQFAIRTAPGSFYRSAELYTAAQSGQWIWAASGVLSRTPQGENLEMQFDERRERRFQLRIYNRDDRPVEIGSLVLSGLETSLVFQAGSGPHWLYFGNRGAAAPVYDLARTLDPSLQPAAARLGPAEANPAWREPARPWTERHPALLYGALALACLALGWVVVRFRRNVTGTTAA